jgi:tetratricopeptide (TPR) repeat protein
VSRALDRGDAKAAVEAAEAAVRVAPANAMAHLWLGRAYGLRALRSGVVGRLGWARKCRAAWERAVALDRGNAAARAHLVEYHLQAPGIAGGSERAARAHADTLLRVDPVRGHIAWAQVHAHDRDSTAALASLRRALAADPPDATLGRQALAGWYTQRGRHAAARALWTERLAAVPGDLYARYMLARIASMSGTDLDEAVGHLRAYLAVPPAPGSAPWYAAHWRLGLVYEKQGRRAEAIAELEQALRLQPASEAVRKDLERIRRAR